MMRSRKLLPALALGLTLVAPMAQSQSMPSLQFPQTGTFCGLLTLCDADVTRAANVAPLTDTHALTKAEAKSTTDVLSTGAETQKAKQ